MIAANLSSDGPMPQVHAKADELRIHSCHSTNQTASTAILDADDAADASKAYKFSRIFEPAKDHSEVIGAFKVHFERFLKGQSTTIFVYGETGSGKTTTMMHLATAFTRGWVADVLSNSATTLHLSAIEVDQEAVYDLLTPAPRQIRLDVCNSEAQRVVWYDLVHRGTSAAQIMFILRCPTTRNDHISCAQIIHVAPSGQLCVWMHPGFS
jgi:hypothetical protein